MVTNMYLVIDKMSENVSLVVSSQDWYVILEIFLFEWNQLLDDKNIFVEVESFCLTTD